MKLIQNLPKQAYIFAWAVLLYLSPLPYIFGDDYQRYILPVYITLQVIFVVACNKFVHERWILAVIIIESVCAMWNALLFLMWKSADNVFFAAFSHFMFIAFALEILIITMSLLGGDYGRGARRHSQSPPVRLLCRLSFRNSQNSGIEVAQ